MKRCFHCMEEYEEDFDSCPVCSFTGEQEKGEWLEVGEILQSRYIVGTCRYQKESDILYIGWDALFSRKVLIQEFFPKRCVTREKEVDLKILEFDSFYKGKEIFVGTGSKLISLDDTPGLINVFGVFEENNTAYITMEYPGDLSLLTIIETCGCFNENDMLQLLKDISIPLMKAHENQVFHGQLCLDICFFDNEQGYKLGGFQEARYLYEDQGQISEKSDVSGLANLGGIVLFGEKEWESSNEEERIELLDKFCSQGIGLTLKNSISRDLENCPETIGVFLQRLLENSKNLEPLPIEKRNIKKNSGWPFWRKIKC